MNKPSALINVPQSAKSGEIIDIKALIAHPMEPGYRRTQFGEILPRDIITHFQCRYNGTVIFQALFYPAIAANPFILFSTIAKESGVMEFNWAGDNGFSVTETTSITVT